MIYSSWSFAATCHESHIERTPISENQCARRTGRSTRGPSTRSPQTAAQRHLLVRGSTLWDISQAEERGRWVSVAEESISYWAYFAYVLSMTSLSLGRRLGWVVSSTPRTLYPDPFARWLDKPQSPTGLSAPVGNRTPILRLFIL
jgi:hypothetical protein